MKRTLVILSAGVLALLLSACGNNDLSRGGAGSLIDERLAGEGKEVTEVIGITSGTADPENTRVAEFRFQWLRDGDVIGHGLGGADFRLYDDGWRVTNTALTIEPVMVEIPVGEYLMGSPDSEEGRFESEGPVHRVQIAKPFAVGIYEVTLGEFKHFVEETGYSAGYRCWTYEDGEVKERSDRTWRNPGYTQGADHPVVCVSWDDAHAYARWLRQKTGKDYRLLSESEWEYVARAGTTTSRHWGDSASGQCRYANGADAALKRQYPDWEWPVTACDDGYVHTSPVGVYSANAYGLHDVSGNVWEWVEDCWNESYQGAPSNGNAWTSGDCRRRVWRGGSWSLIPRYLRSADRDWSGTGVRGNSLGFRLARTL